MKTLTVPTDFSDCSNADMQHYFEGTVAVWMMTPTKKRVFLIGGIDSDEAGRAVINGQYLTRQKQWKHKALLLNGWNTTLKPILSKVISFNHEGVAAFLAPNRTKELKKGLKWNYTGIKWWYGDVEKHNATAESITYEAFKDLYTDPSKIYHPTLLELVETGVQKNQSVITHNGFVIDSVNRFWYRKNHVGEYLPKTRSLTVSPHFNRIFGPYLEKYEGLKGRVL